MTEVIFNSVDVKLEGTYHKNPNPAAPLALILPDHMSFGGNMNSKPAFAMFQAFVDLGFTVLRFNYRGVGKSQGKFDDGSEFTDAASALDWIQFMNKDARLCWMGGYGFGSWIGMQLLMRRPEINEFVSVAPITNIKDYGFLAPCPTSGLIVQGTGDNIASETSVSFLAEKLAIQKGIDVEYKTISGADHNFEGHLKPLYSAIREYVTHRLESTVQKVGKGKKAKKI